MSEQPKSRVVVRRLATFDSGHDDTDRDRWPSRTAFYLAAIGSAVGFGNVWRFPALAKDYGGGAFFIPYVMAFVLIGLPALILEISMGQVYQTGNVGVFGRFHARYRGIGMMSAAAAFMLVVFYSMLLAWTIHAFFDSFGDDDPWAKEGVTGDEAVEYFLNELVGMGTLTNDDLRPTRVMWANVGYSALNWICIYSSLAFGLTSTGYLVYFTMGLPVLLLFVFVGKAVTLTGSSLGIQEYIGKWELSVLTEQPAVWSTAVSQIFFSLSVTFGTMTAYGSHCPMGEPATINAAVIGTSNCMFSFLSGFAVFSALGHLSYIQGVDVNDLPYDGVGLTFGTWPVVFGTFPGGEHWVRLLFFDLFLLGIDSAFSVLESPVTVFMDYNQKRELGFKKWQVTLCFSVLGFFLSWMYATDAGLIMLDAVNFYIDFILLMIGFLETFGAGWVYGIEEQLEKFGHGAVCSYMFSNFGSILTACIIWFGTSGDNVVWGGFLALFVLYFAGVGATLCFLKPRVAGTGQSLSTLLQELAFGNVQSLRQELMKYTGYLPFAWAFMMKQLIPQVLLILFINLCAAETESGKALFGHFDDLEAWPYQVVGIMCVVFVVVILLVGLIMPDVYEGFDLVADQVAWDDPNKEEDSDERTREDIEAWR